MVVTGIFPNPLKGEHPMNAKTYQKLKKLVSLLDQAALLADDLSLENGSGAMIGSLIGAIATEIQLDLQQVRP